jgi:hypothetical protein
MKNNIFYYALVAIAAFCMGFLMCQNIDNNYQLITIQAKALEKAEEVMDQNNLWDIDGTDTMDDYYVLKAKADSLLSQW